MGIQAAPEVKFAIIREATRRDDNLLKISTMCRIANVSRSGYYNWCASEAIRQAREDADRRDFDLILEAYRFRGYDKGARGIHIRLLHKPGIIMNVSISAARSARPIPIVAWPRPSPPAMSLPTSWTAGSDRRPARSC